MRSQRQPRGEVFGVRPGRKVGSTFCNQLEHKIWTQPVDLRQIDAKHRVKILVHIEGWSVDTPPLVARGRKRLGRFWSRRLQPVKDLLDPPTAVRHLCLIGVVQFNGLGEGVDAGMT